MPQSAPRIHQAITLLIAVFLLLHGAVDAATPPVADLSILSDGLWRDVEQRDVPASGERLIVPERYRQVAIDVDVFRQQFFGAPMESSVAAQGSPVVVALPLPDGGVARFQIVETAVMAPELAARFPEIRTWVGQGIDEPASTTRLDWTPQGFHAMILSPANGRVFIDPYSRNDTTNYISYYTRDHVLSGRSSFFELPPDDPGGMRSAQIQSLMALSPQRSSGTQLRTYRLALAATGEYTTFHGGTVVLGQAALVTAMNRVNGIYETEVAIRMQLVANNNLLVYTDPNTDPYTNSNGSTMLGQNQANVDTVIGASNYDIGHVFSTGGGGIASLGVPCVGGSKARGVTGNSSPVGDSFWVDYVVHEMGHQFGANHSFNGVAGNCGGGNRNAGTAYEPGSGTTIMAYAGICGTDDLQPHSDAYFHSVSFDEIVTYSTVGNGNACPVITSTGNTLPVSSVPAGGFTIPASTPFALTGSATDANGDGLTYNWEEFDLGAGGPPGVATNPPFFRSWLATTSPTRTFPALSNLLSNTLAKGEVLPNATRALNFRMTVRDNRAGGGGVVYSALGFNVTTAAGPFQVTSPNTAVSWAAGSAQTITWNVAGTTSAPVNCANVDILLSTDGGLTFPTALLTGTPNDGSQAVTIPNAPTTSARVKVACSTNVFFDISDTNFTIGPPGAADTAGIYVASTGAFFLKNTNAGGAADIVFTYGPSSSSFVPLAGDWNGDGVVTIGLYDPATGAFFLKNSNAPGAADIVFTYGPGGAGWKPVVGDWNGDGVDTIGLYNPATGTFFLKNTNAAGSADIVFGFGPGGAGWKPLAGDWNGDGVTTVGVYDPATGNFFLRNSNTPGAADIVYGFGPPNATPLAGDWNNDGIATVGIYVPATGAWFLRNTHGPGAADIVFTFGPANVTPITGNWNGGP